MPLGTLASGVILLAMGVLTLITAVTGPSMSSSGWRETMTAWLQHASSVTGKALHWLPGWLANSGGGHDNGVWFWLKNTGLFIPLLLVGQLWRGTMADGFSLYFAPLWLWFLVPNFVVLQPWDWDNTKFFSYWMLFGALAVGAVLARLAKSAGARLLKERRHVNVAAVALAAKHARIAWAILAHGTEYRPAGPEVVAA